MSDEESQFDGSWVGSGDEDGSRDLLLGRMADELADALEAGEKIDLAEYQQRYPELADELPGVLASIRSLHRRKGRSATFVEGLVQREYLGEYRLIREIGRGGMGIVYEAEQEPLRRRVAVKVYPFLAMLDPKKLKRFKNEAISAASLDHPHIVPVYGMGVDRGTHFFVMRLIAGRSLANVLGEPARELDADHAIAGATSSTEPGQHPRKQSATGEQVDDEVPAPTGLHSRSAQFRDEDRNRLLAVWIRDAALALHFAHEKGIVHRDVKPGNLLIDEHDHIWVTDFGLATNVVGETVTHSGDVVGTVAYMSPEQLFGESSEVTARSDVYSLGVTLWEAVCGRHPFARARNIPLMERIRRGELGMGLRRGQGRSRDLVTVAMKAMRRAPEERYQSAAELAADLARFLEGDAILARRTDVVGRVLRRCQRQWQAWSWTAVTCMALVSLVLHFTGGGMGRGGLSGPARTEATVLAEFQQRHLRQVAADEGLTEVHLETFLFDGGTYTIFETHDPHRFRYFHHGVLSTDRMVKTEKMEHGDMYEHGRYVLDWPVTYEESVDGKRQPIIRIEQKYACRVGGEDFAYSVAIYVAEGDAFRKVFEKVHPNWRNADKKGDLRSGDAILLSTRVRRLMSYYHLTADVGRGNRRLGERRAGQNELGLVTVKADDNTMPQESDQLWWIQKVDGEGAICSGDLVTLRTRTKTEPIPYHLTAELGQGNRQIGPRPPETEDCGLVTVVPERGLDPLTSDQIWCIEKVDGDGPIQTGDQVMLHARKGPDGEFHYLTAESGRGNCSFGEPRPAGMEDVGLATVVPQRNTDSDVSDQIWWLEIW
ncbi:MAG: serine/threonine-protein kinase [Pirellulaceae bacterium]|nr:serine/threonine protein kinase [Planctomycetales bacterium]MCA9265378.1 serine/threonine protein kinase [Planctomycetales bacterium]